jgi:hypothetical protein
MQNQKPISEASSEMGFFITTIGLGKCLNVVSPLRALGGLPCDLNGSNFFSAKHRRMIHRKKSTDIFTKNRQSCLAHPLAAE